MNTLALDLGTHTGWAWSDGNGLVISGTWDFTTKRHTGGGMKYVRFKDCLDGQKAKFGVDQIFFEEVRRHAGTQAAHVYGGFKAHLEAWCEVSQVPYESVPVSQIKKYWTGSGNAHKRAMMAAAYRRGYEPVDDNEADALAILHFKGGAQEWSDDLIG